MNKQVKITSGSPELFRFLVQKCLNYCALWPLETQFAYDEFAWCCSIIDCQLVSQNGIIWLEQIN